MAMESGLGSERKTDLSVEMGDLLGVGSVWKHGKGDGHGERSVLFAFPVYIPAYPSCF